MPTNVAARMTLAADPGLAAGRGRGRDPRLRPRDPRDGRGVRAAARGARRRGSIAGEEPGGRRGRHGRRRSATPASGCPASGIPVHRPVDPRAERILELADERGVSGPHVRARARVPRRRRRGLGPAADDERLDADRGGDARPRLRAGRGEGGADPRPDRRPAGAPRRGARAADRLLDGARAAEEAVAYEPPRTPAADARARGRDPAVGGAARARRRSLPRAARLPVRALAPSTATSSPRRGSATPRRPAGSRRSRALPLTEKHELRATVTAENPIGAHLCAAPRRDRAHLLDERHHRHAELHPADRRRPRQLGRPARRAATPPRGSRPASASSPPTTPGPFVAGAALGAFDRIGLCHIPVGTGNTERLMQGGRAAARPRRRR